MQQCPKLKAVCCWRSYNLQRLKTPLQRNLNYKANHFQVSQKFVPKCHPLQTSDVELIQNFVSKSNQLLVITGAGLSTESGIPDYRSEGVGLFSRSSYRPVLHEDFLKFAERRKTYWARSYIGWKYFSSRKPNNSHITFYEWENAGKLSWLVTQNVDSLHAKAGSKKLTELHGSIRRVICLNCGEVTSRESLQEKMREHNPYFDAEPIEIAPDGDVILTQSQVEQFQVLPCQSCAGILKPQVVFFGDNVSRNIVEFLKTKVAKSDAVLVAGSSLEVFSAFRFIRTAHEAKKPIAIINIGPTRADRYAETKINAKLGDVLPLIQV